MARIEFPDRGLGQHIDWALPRAAMAAGMGALSEAVYGNSELPTREREAARWTIALINDCAVCQDTRTADAAEVGIADDFYTSIGDWPNAADLTDRERLAAEFAFKFATDHQAMNDEFWDRLRSAFSDEEITDLTICCGMFLGMGRTLAVIEVPAPDERIII